MSISPSSLSARSSALSAELDAEKAALRKAVFARRKEAHLSGGSAAAAAATRFLETVAVAEGEEVAGYRPIRTEIDPTPLMRALYERGAALSVPVIVAAGAPLSFRRWTPDCAMTAGPFGAEIPAEGEMVSPSLFITPLVAFDRAGGRLGYGGGFYDRTFAEARAARAIRAVGFAYAAQEVAQTPAAPTDQRLDLIITEDAAIRTR